MWVALRAPLVDEDVERAVNEISMQFYLDLSSKRDRNDEQKR